MKRVVSISGGKTSAYIAANYPQDDIVFALVRTDDVRCKFKDETLRKRVEDEIQKPFIGTLENDTIIYTILDLEQYLGKKINWVSGITFDEVTQTKGGWLPSKLRRFCTQEMKLEPIFNWWKEKYFFEPVLMDIGYRYTERNRKKNMVDKLNKNGLSEHKGIVGNHIKGRWAGHFMYKSTEWRKPNFPLIDDQVFKDEIENFWELKKVRFAEFNNCIGCFHRNANLLQYQSKKHPNKFNWFVEQEQIGKGNWKKEFSYQKVLDMPQVMSFGRYGTCNSGFCGV